MDRLLERRIGVPLFQEVVGGRGKKRFEPALALLGCESTELLEGLPSNRVEEGKRSVVLDLVSELCHVPAGESRRGLARGETMPLDLGRPRSLVDPIELQDQVLDVAPATCGDADQEEQGVGAPAF